MKEGSMKEHDLIAVTLSRPGFEYDIHSLIKAFYPECDVKVFTEGEKEYVSCEGLPHFYITFDRNKILLSTVICNGPSASFKAAKTLMQEAELKPGAERTEVKNLLKQFLYQELSDYTGNKLPWGTLTGIRPTKIPMNMLEEQKSDEDILEYMKKTYYISDEKGTLALDIAKRERKILSAIHYRDGYSLYIGIPFCPTTCLYCSFTSFPIAAWKKRVCDYLKALEKEILFTAGLYRDKILDTVYIGGGTPTTLEAEELERLLLKIKESFDFTQVKEFTVEAGRADSITLQKLKVLKKYGVTRISVNPQTMKQETLRVIGRQHTVEQVEEAFFMAREAGFFNINMDLIMGLPGEDEEDVKNTINRIEQFLPDSLTVHSLAVKRASRLNQWIEENGIKTLRNTDATMRLAMEGAGRMGMQPYYLYRQKNMSGNFENVGYAKEGCYGIYNILIMEEKQTIVALGAGSITKRVDRNGRIERCDNVKDVGIYIERIDEMIERKQNLLGREGDK